MVKKRSVISYSNLTPELLEAFKAQYPYGYSNAVIKVDKPNGDSFYGVTMETDDAVYLVKVNVKIDARAKDEDEENALLKSMGNSGNDGTPDEFDDLPVDQTDGDDESLAMSISDEDVDDDM